MSDIQRRAFIGLLGGGAVVWPLAARAQQSVPVIGLLHSASPDAFEPPLAACRQSLNEAGYVEGQSVAIEYRWAEGRYQLMPELVADLIRRRVAIIAMIRPH